MEPKWYIVHAYSNFEKKVAEAIRQGAKEKGLEAFIEDVFVPTEEVTEVRRGRKINTERRFYPGYVLVKMALNDQTYHLVKDTPKVTGFLGSGKTPIPVSQKEVDRIRGVMTDSVERPRPSMPSICAALVERWQPDPLPQLRVADTRRALGLLAAASSYGQGLHRGSDLGDGCGGHGSASLGGTCGASGAARTEMGTILG